MGYALGYRRAFRSISFRCSVTYFLGWMATQTNHDIAIALCFSAHSVERRCFSHLRTASASCGGLAARGRDRTSGRDIYGQRTDTLGDNLRKPRRGHGFRPHKRAAHGLTSYADARINASAAAALAASASMALFRRVPGDENTISLRE